jgi:hypothetical protein
MKSGLKKYKLLFVMDKYSIQKCRLGGIYVDSVVLLLD